MIHAIVSVVLNQLGSLAVEEAKQQVRLVVGVDKELENLESNFRAIQAVLADAEQRQHKEEDIRHWLDEVKHASYDMEDVLDEWITAILKRQIEEVDENALIPHTMKVCSIFSAASWFGFEPVFLRHDIALKVKSINQKLDDISRRKDMFNLSDTRSTEKDDSILTSSLIDEYEVHGRDKEKNTLKSKLLCVSSENKNAVPIISLVGMGGIGKTTLAQLVYNDNDVINEFQSRIWVCVSEPFDHTRIAKAIIEALEDEALEDSTPNLVELNSLMERIKKSIAKKKFLLVLDDVWIDDHNKWEPFHRCLINGGKESKILVTTRKESVAQMMKSINIVFIEELSKQDSWSLFKHFAFSGKSPEDCKQLEEIGKKIVFKCKGLPLAVKIIGSLLRFKRTKKEWQSVLDSGLWQLNEFEKNVLPSLLLSYNDLPSKIKPYFSYCAIFPKDYDIYKNELIQLWMAQSYIRPEGNREVEMIGEDYFYYLVSRSFFQESEKDHNGTIVSCKMHDMVHHLAQSVTKNECVSPELNDHENLLSLESSFEQKLRHLMVVLGNEDAFPVSIFKAEKLRSLVIDSESVIGLKEIFDQLTYLRTLKIIDKCDPKISEIPKEIAKLTHLRCLKLNGLGIKKLPETCCELFNLQTLDLSGCWDLRELPQGIGKLVNLRHLILDDYVCLEYMPKGIERLTCLRTLSKFVGNSSDIDGSKACKLEGLRHLNHLRGSIRIELFGNVRNVDEAKNVDLEKKENLVDLELDFPMDLENEANHEAICEALRPPQNLESLNIQRYEGKTRWPNWIVSLHKLKELTLIDSYECVIMPPLGKLPSLELLIIRAMRRLERVGDEFLGIERDDVHGTFSSVIAFPKLKRLIFEGLPIWEEWDFKKEDIAIMPELSHLHIFGCENLRSLPNQLLRSTTLNKLEIINCPILEETFKKDTAKDGSETYHIPNIQIN